MKNIKRFLAVILASVFVFAVVSCEKGKDIDFPSHSEELGVDRFLKTDWGMSLEQTLEALGLEKSDVEQARGTGVPNGEKYRVEKEMKVNGLKATVYLTFHSTVGDLFSSANEDVKDCKVGLAEVKLFFNEDNIEKVEKAFANELKDGEQSNVDIIPGLNDGKDIAKGRLQDIKDEELKNNFLKIYGDAVKVADVQLYYFTLGTLSESDAESVNAKQVVGYNGALVSILNNLDK